MEGKSVGLGIQSGYLIDGVWHEDGGWLMNERMWWSRDQVITITSNLNLRLTAKACGHVLQAKRLWLDIRNHFLDPGLLPDCLTLTLLLLQQTSDHIRIQVFFSKAYSMHSLNVADMLHSDPDVSSKGDSTYNRWRKRISFLSLFQ